MCAGSITKSVATGNPYVALVTHFLRTWRTPLFHSSAVSPNPSSLTGLKPGVLDATPPTPPPPGVLPELPAAKRHQLQQTPHRSWPTGQHMPVDHRGAHVRVIEQFLQRANIVILLQQVRRKRMPQRVTARPLRDARRCHRQLTARPKPRSFTRKFSASNSPSPGPESSIAMSRVAPCNRPSTAATSPANGTTGSGSRRYTGLSFTHASGVPRNGESRVILSSSRRDPVSQMEETHRPSLPVASRTSTPVSPR